MAACAGVARAAGVTFRCVATYAFAAIFGLSLLHSVVSAAVDPEYAYFEPSARWWEFAAGSLAALLVTRPGRGKIADTAGWLGVALIVVCAFGAGPEARFPGWISLLPVLGACLVLGGTGTGNRLNVDDALSWRSLVWVGRHSYGLYLRHWPLLITYMLRSANDSVPVSAGLAIMVASLLLTLATEWLVRKAMPVGGPADHGASLPRGGPRHGPRSGVGHGLDPGSGEPSRGRGGHGRKLSRSGVVIRRPGTGWSSSDPGSR